MPNLEMPPVAARRTAYLATAVDLRKAAYAVHSLEARAAYMHLAVLYEELAEYAALAAIVPPAHGCGCAR